MNVYVVKQPILDNNNETFGYELLYRNSMENAFTDEDADSSSANVISNLLSNTEMESILENKKAFITFTPNLLMKNIAKIFPPEKLIIQIEDSVVLETSSLMKMFEDLQEEGYEIALKGFEFNPRYLSCLEMVDYIKIDFSKNTESTNKNIIDICKRLKKKIIIENLETQEAFSQAKEIGFDYAQGRYFATPTITAVKSVQHIQSNFFQLIVLLTQPEPDMEEIEKVILRDVTMTFKLIKLVNSAYFSLKNRVNSVKQAMMILGIAQLKEWVYLLSFQSSNNEKPSELIKLSFLRGNFCEALSKHIKNMPITTSEAYLLGMFSTLDSLLDIPLEKALEDLPIHEAVKDALLKNEGVCGSLYQFILAYEVGDWSVISKKAKELDIPENAITHTYFECVESVNQIWNSLMD